MKPVRVAVVTALLVVTAGVLGTPWMQVVQEYTRTEEVVYTQTETHTSLGYVTELEETGSAIVMQTKMDFPARPYYLGVGSPPLQYAGIPYEMNFTKGQVVKVELQAKPNAPNGTFTLMLCYNVFTLPGVRGQDVPVFFEHTACSWTFNGTDMEYANAPCIYETGQPPRCPPGCTIPLTGTYYLFFQSEKDVTVDFRVLTVDYRTNTLAVATTEFSTVLQTSKFTTTRYNTTYKRPLG